MCVRTQDRSPQRLKPGRKEGSNVGPKGPTPWVRDHLLGLRYCPHFPCPSISNTRKSRKLFPVGPVITASSSAAKNLCASLSRNAAAGSKPSVRAREIVSPSATAPAAGLFPSIPSVPALKTVIFRPAIFCAQASTNAEFLPPTPFPVTGELTSPSAISATRSPGFSRCHPSSCSSKYPAAFSTGQSSVELSQQVTKPQASVAWCAA